MELRRYAQDPFVSVQLRDAWRSKTSGENARPFPLEQQANGANNASLPIVPQ
jgi:hypothetical protein